MPLKTNEEYNAYDDRGLFEVEAVRSEILRLERLVAFLAAHNYTGLVNTVEDVIVVLGRAAVRAEEEINERNRKIL